MRLLVTENATLLMEWTLKRKDVGRQFPIALVKTTCLIDGRHNRNFLVLQVVGC
jgi:hypothetical protein